MSDSTRLYNTSSHSTSSSTSLRDLVGLLPSDLMTLMTEINEEPFRAKQLWHWIYYRGTTSFTTMSNLSNTCRAKLARHFIVSRPLVVRTFVSSDSTCKWLLRFQDGQEIETVYIPEEERGTVCLSSQVGCTLTCRFCHTGTQTFVRNLSAAEIIGQFLTVRDACNSWPSCPGKYLSNMRSLDNLHSRSLSNVVIMGMGEPLFNYNQIICALKILMHPAGLAIPRRRITLSTSGVVPMIRLLRNDVTCNLAVSLHATTNTVRDILMPINKKYPIESLIAACRDYSSVSHANRITFEYIMLKNVNDSEADARAITKLVKGIPCKFNLIPFNQWPGAPYTCSTEASLRSFAEILKNAGYSVSIRVQRGRDIYAACGQLRSASLRERLSRYKARLAAGLIDEDYITQKTSE